ncbi:MAG: hypothetical protein ACKPCJ_11060, partial [Betaproteobacteria bacterium]
SAVRYPDRHPLVPARSAVQPMSTSAAAPREHRFLWEGRDRHGQSRRGELMATDAGAVQTHLSRQGVFMTRARRRDGACRRP